LAAYFAAIRSTALDTRYASVFIGAGKSMRRREFITLVGGAAVLPLALPFMAHAQQAHIVRRIGILTTTPAAATRPSIEAFLEGMARLGYDSGRDIILIARHAEGVINRLPGLAAELVEAKPEVLVVASRPAIAAAQRATKVIPIVMTAVGDPVKAGFVASLAKPGGNITELSNLAPQLSGKRVEILKEVIPNLKRVAVVRNPSIATFAAMWRETERAADVFGIVAVPVDITAPADVETAFATMVRERVQAAVFLSDAVTSSQAPKIVQLAAKQRLPVMYPLISFMKAGGLVMYGPDAVDMWRRGAYYVDQIFKGMKPGDIPVQQPTRFELVINLKTAKALGLTVPPSLLTRADKVIE
jgi:ABC-type uncharacterized transport system substrate-binding protein